jgi:integrase
MQELAPHLKPIIRAKLYLALRTRNLLDLTWDQIDFERELIIIPETKNGEELIQPMIQLLKELSNDLPRRSAYVFWDTEERPYKRIIKGFRAACKRAGIDDFCPHDIRRTFGIHLIANGCDINTLKELLGHKTLKMTLLYVQSLPEIKRSSMKIIGELFKETGGNDGTSDENRADGSHG